MSKTRPSLTEHDGEPIPGLPERPPEGETILWQGRPRWGGLARRALHVRGLALYFGLLAVWRGAVLTAEGADAWGATAGAAVVVTVGLVPILMLAGFAWLSARTALYTITNRRVVMRVGVALPMTVNLPFAAIGQAGLAMHADGTGDIRLKLMRPHRASWVALWPHVRTWRVTRPEPMLRALPDAQAAAQVLSRALAAHAAVAVQPVPVPAEGRAPAARPGAAAIA